MISDYVIPLAYWVEAKFGTSDKTFRLVLDTGSVSRLGEFETGILYISNSLP